LARDRRPWGVARAGEADMTDAAAQDRAVERRMMVDCQLRTFAITDRAVLAAFDTVPREAFVAPGDMSFAYADRDVAARDFPGRFLVAPMELARMIQALRIVPGSRVLDVAGGPGYGAALLAQLGATVTALESTWPESATATLRSLAPAPIACVAGPVAEGHVAGAPYDAILLDGAAEREPSALIAQLRDGGRLVCGDRSGELDTIVCFERLGTSFRKRAVVDAQLPVIAEFVAAPAFVF
jgi:protein-L-isoaspartate(D-aspartate) O-methyltransferase